MTELSEQKIIAMATQLPYPSVPKARQKPQHLYRDWLVRAALLVVVMGIGLMSVADIRARVLDMLQIGAVRIYIETLEYDASPLTLDDLQGETTLTEAQAVLDTLYTVGNRQPDRVFVQEDNLSIFIWLDGQAIDYALYQIPQPNWFAVKSAASVEVVELNNRQAYWINHPHPVTFINQDTAQTHLVYLVTGNVLIWNEGRHSLRLETGKTLEESLALAQIVQLLETSR